MISLHPVGRWPMSNRVNLFYVIWADIGNMEMGLAQWPPASRQIRID
jgi:hypothetical protein